MIRASGRTAVLAAIATAALLVQVFPDHAGFIKWAAIILGIVYIGARALLFYPRWYRDKRARAAQQAADDEAYRNYSRELDTLRARHATPDDGQPAVSPDLAAELAALHDKYQAMLARKFGPG